MSLFHSVSSNYCCFSTSYGVCVIISAGQHDYEALKENSSIVTVVFHSSKLQNISKSVSEIALTHQQCCLVCVGVSVPCGRMAHHNRVITVFFKEVLLNTWLLKRTWDWLLLVFFPMAEMANWPCVTIFWINFTPPKMQLQVWSNFTFCITFSLSQLEQKVKLVNCKSLC